MTSLPTREEIAEILTKARAWWFAEPTSMLRQATTPEEYQADAILARLRPPAWEELARLQVQLAGCSVAALGGANELDLRLKHDVLRANLFKLQEIINEKLPIYVVKIGDLKADLKACAEALDKVISCSPPTSEANIIARAAFARPGVQEAIR